MSINNMTVTESCTFVNINVNTSFCSQNVLHIM